MRDPKRIQRMTALFNSLWQTYPDMRFTQMMDLVTTQIQKMKGGDHTTDVFNVEDDVAEKAIHSLLMGEQL